MFAVYDLSGDQPVKVTEVGTIEQAYDFAHATGLTWKAYGIFDYQCQEWYTPFAGGPLGLFVPGNVIDMIGV